MRHIGAVLALLLAACQPLPQPFSHNGSPDLELLALPDHGGIIVLPVSEAPPSTADALASAMVAALIDANVPASRGGGNRDSAFLQGRVEDDGHDARLVWELFDGGGALIGAHAQPIEGTPLGPWRAAEPELMANLATASAADIAAMIQNAAPVELAAPRIFVAPVVGAPGDGGSRLEAAIRAALAAVDIAVADTVDGDTLALAGEVVIADLGNGDESVAFAWTLRNAQGRRLGVIRQANQVPAGSLQRQWGMVAEAVAIGTAEGIADLLTRVDWLPADAPAPAS